MQRIIAFAAALLLSFIAAGARAELVIAVAGPMTGQYAAFGEQLRRGAEMAVADLNARGGVLGRKLRLEVADDACDPKQAVAVANQLANKGAVFVDGHYCSGSSIPASDVYREEGILQVSPASTNPQLTDRGYPNVFRTCGRDDQQGIVAGDYIADHFKDVNVAILHDKTAYGQGVAEEFRRKAAQNGATGSFTRRCGVNLRPIRKRTVVTRSHSLCSRADRQRSRNPSDCV